MGKACFRRKSAKEEAKEGKTVASGGGRNAGSCNGCNPPKRRLAPGYALNYAVPSTEITKVVAQSEVLLTSYFSRMLGCLPKADILECGKHDSLGAFTVLRL